MLLEAYGCNTFSEGLVQNGHLWKRGGKRTYGIGMVTQAANELKNGTSIWGKKGSELMPLPCQKVSELLPIAFKLGYVWYGKFSMENASFLGSILFHFFLLLFLTTQSFIILHLFNHTLFKKKENTIPIIKFWKKMGPNELLAEKIQIIFPSLGFPKFVLLLPVSKGKIRIFWCLTAYFINHYFSSYIQIRNSFLVNSELPLQIPIFTFGCFCILFLRQEIDSFCLK